MGWWELPHLMQDALTEQFGEEGFGTSSPPKCLVVGSCLVAGPAPKLSSCRACTLFPPKMGKKVQNVAQLLEKLKIATKWLPK